MVQLEWTMQTEQPLDQSQSKLTTGQQLVPQTNVASVGSAFKGTRKVKVLSLPETIKENQHFEQRLFIGKLVIKH